MGWPLALILLPSRFHPDQQRHCEEVASLSSYYLGDALTLCSTSTTAVSLPLPSYPLLSSSLHTAIVVVMRGFMAHSSAGLTDDAIV
ncbi:hypothetical protein DTO271D3_1084 [Paecilomyces variotii]|nr:hypothetical protein DTO169C6_2246 [Paecilomyces variotii]KAJ9240994.1 hypothetical protein DTO169E5_3689 [Paecilomyces variotii]KAJ9318422.1 hypothetical protein DTO271D3_1084 [Paecilomyces variotii]